MFCLVTRLLDIGEYPALDVGRTSEHDHRAAPGRPADGRRPGDAHQAGIFLIAAGAFCGSLSRQVPRTGLNVRVVGVVLILAGVLGLLPRLARW